MAEILELLKNRTEEDRIRLLTPEQRQAWDSSCTDIGGQTVPRHLDRPSAGFAVPIWQGDIVIASLGLYLLLSRLRQTDDKKLSEAVSQAARAISKCEQKEAYMQETMSGKERILAAMSGQMPDRVPVQLGITNMFSVYQQGLVGWDVYAYNKQPMWRVVADTQRRFGLDGYLYLRPAVKRRPGDPPRKTTLTRLNENKLERRTVIHTPEGDLTSAETIMKNESPTVTEGLIKSERDFALWLKYGFPDDTDYDLASISEPIAYMGHNGTCAGSASIPGLHALTDLFQGRLAAATYFITDYPDYLDLYREKAERHLLRAVEQVIDAGVDYIELSGSGMLTLSTPDLFRQLCLPFIRKAAAICSQAGILVEVHCCGKARLVVEDLYRETAVNSVNPLQPPPMGDCDLAKIKQSFGDRLCLKGNVGVTHPLLFGTPDDVERDVLRCLDAAKAGGRFILFSEEGIGALTPAENVSRYVAAAKTYGAY